MPSEWPQASDKAEGIGMAALESTPGVDQVTRLARRYEHMPQYLVQNAQGEHCLVHIQTFACAYGGESEWSGLCLQAIQRLRDNQYIQTMPIFLLGICMRPDTEGLDCTFHGWDDFNRAMRDGLPAFRSSAPDTDTDTYTDER